MSQFTVKLLEESIEDMKIGRLFYEENEEGIGAYFVDSAMSDITSLRLYAKKKRNSPKIRAKESNNKDSAP